MKESDLRIERAVQGLHESLIMQIPGSLDSQSRILDVGCGSGAWLERLYRRGMQNLHGVDADIEQSKGIHATVSQVNLDSIDWGDALGKFDLISAIEVLEHLESPGYFFNQVSRLLADNGMFLLTAPNLHSVICRLRFFLLSKLKQFDNKGDPTHIYPVFVDNLEKLLVRHGLEIHKIWGYPESGGSQTSRPVTNLLGWVLSAILPERVAGDVLCVLIIRSPQNL